MKRVSTSLDRLWKGSDAEQREVISISVYVEGAGEIGRSQIREVNLQIRQDVCKHSLTLLYFNDL